VVTTANFYGFTHFQKTTLSLNSEFLSFYFKSMLKTYKMHPFPESFLALRAMIFYSGCIKTASALFGFLVYLKF